LYYKYGIQALTAAALLAVPVCACSPGLTTTLSDCVLLQFFRIIFNFSFPWYIDRESG
jgi:hypothetical protein